MPKETIDYSNTIIYKIYCKDETITDIYVGHTTNFTKRKCLHKTACNNLNNKSKIYNTIRENGGWENWNMIEIAKYNCNDHTEARIKEHEHYKELKASLNSIPPYVDKTNYFCFTCKLQCNNQKDYDNHILCNLHNKKMQGIDNEETKWLANFVCELCDYNTSRKNNYETHLQSNKHKIKELTTDDNDFKQKISKKYQCQKCDKEFNDRAGLWRHNKKCELEDDNEEANIKYNQPPDKDLIMLLIKENHDFKNMLLEQNKTIIELSKKILHYQYK